MKSLKQRRKECTVILLCFSYYVNIITNIILKSLIYLREWSKQRSHFSGPLCCWTLYWNLCPFINWFFCREGDKPAGHQRGLGTGSRGQQHPVHGHPHQGARQTEEDPWDREGHQGAPGAGAQTDREEVHHTGGGQQLPEGGEPHRGEPAQVDGGAGWVSGNCCTFSGVGGK